LPRSLPLLFSATARCTPREGARGSASSGDGLPVIVDQTSNGSPGRPGQLEYLDTINNDRLVGSGIIESGNTSVVGGRAVARRGLAGQECAMHKSMMAIPHLPGE